MGNFWQPNNKDQKDENSESSKKGMGSTGWILGLTVFFLVAAVFWAFASNNNEPVTNISYTEFRSQIRGGNVRTVTVDGQEITGELKQPINRMQAGEDFEIDRFTTYLPSFGDDSLFPLLEEQNVTVETRPQSSVSWWMVLLNILPFVLFIGLGLLLFRRFSGQGEDVMGMTKSRARRYDAKLQRVTFDDVAGASGAKEELEEIIEFLRTPEQFRQLGAQIPKGVLLIGPPGTGKTLLARAVAGEANVPFFSLSGSDFMEVFVGVGASRVRDLFQEAKKSAPSIIFIDELDSIGRRRGAGIGGGHDEREQTLNQMLSEMDGFEPNDHVIVMAATNRPDILDPALQRPGRFDRQIMVDTPTMNERVEILAIHARNKPLADDVDLEKVARGTPGFSGADLANLLNEGALLAARRRMSRIGNDEINDARDKVLMGLERNLILTPDEAELIAYHEAGHAIVAAVLPYADPVHKVTIIPRGRAMGVTQQLPERDRYLYPRDYLLDRLAVMMGGRAAEELALNTMTSGAADDFKQATRIARHMVLDWGMSTRVGFVSLGDDSGPVFLGEDMAQKRAYSEMTAREVDEEVRSILDEAYTRAKDTLNEYREGMDKVVEVLVDQEQLSGETLMRILGLEEKIPTIQPA